MDKASLLDIMAFTDFAWENVQESFQSDEEALLREAPGSGWPTPRNCLAHILNGRVRWNAAIIDGKSVGVPDLADDALHTWAELNAFRAETGDKLRSFIESRSEDELQTRREIDIDGDMLTYSEMELALHLVLHEVSHHGDISTLMYQLKMEPWVPYYRFHANRDAD